MSYLPFEDSHNKYLNDMPLHQQYAIKQYINGSSYLNSILRDGFNVQNPEHCKFYEKDKMAQRIQNMDAALTSPNLKKINKQQKPFEVYRGINSPTLGVKIQQSGFLHHPHYMSTSKDLSVAAKSFAGDSCCVFKITVNPEEATCPSFLYVSGQKGTSENEVLFQRNTYLIFDKLVGNMYHVIASTVPPQQPSFCSNGNSVSSNNSQSTSIRELIAFSDIEDEISFLSDDVMTNDSDAIEAITTSLLTVYSHIPKSDIKTRVEELYSELKSKQQGGQKKGRQARNKRLSTKKI